SIQAVRRVLDREAYYLRAWNRQARPAFFAQHLRVAATAAKLTWLADMSVNWLQQLGLPYLELTWRTGQEPLALARVLTGHSAKVLRVVITQDGRWAVSSAFDSVLKAWNLESGEGTYSLIDHMGLVFSLSIRSDGGRALCASTDGTLRVWDLTTGEIVH